MAAYRPQPENRRRPARRSSLLQTPQTYRPPRNRGGSAAIGTVREDANPGAGTARTGENPLFANLVLACPFAVVDDAKGNDRFLPDFLQVVSEIDRTPPPLVFFL